LADSGAGAPDQAWLQVRAAGSSFIVKTFMGLPKMFMRKKNFSARKSLSTLIRHAFRVEALEPRILLSADPVMGALQAILPDDRDRDGVPPGSYDIFNDPDYA
jgi:hypothetical protein